MRRPGNCSSFKTLTISGPVPISDGERRERQPRIWAVPIGRVGEGGVRGTSTISGFTIEAAPSYFTELTGLDWEFTLG